MPIFDYKEIESPADDPVYNDYSSFGGIPIIIDNGSYQCRAGYAKEDKPRLIFKSLVGKVKSTAAPVVGNAIKESEISRLTIRSPFDSNILVHPPSQECILDYIFEKLGVNKQIDNPILFTEPTANPSYYTSELLFECYQAPSVVYGIDSLFAYYGQKHQFEDNGKEALIVSSGHCTTHIYNVKGGRVDQYQTKRINVGGGTGSDYLRKLIHLKYPNHKSYFTPNYTNEVKEKHLLFSNQSYVEKIEEFGIEDQSNTTTTTPTLTHIIQLPFQEVDLEKLEEDKQRKIQQRKELGQKQREKMEIKRKEKSVEYIEQLNSYEAIQALKSTNLEEFNNSLEGQEMSERDLLKAIDELREKLGRKRDPIPEMTNEEEFPLLFVTDDLLSPEQIKEKRKQKMLKGAKDAKLSAKRKRDEEKEKEDAITRKEEEEYDKDPEVYMKQLYERRNKIVERKEQREKSKTKVIRRQAKLRTVVITEKRGEDEVDEEEDQDNAALAQVEKLLDKFEPGWNASPEDDPAQHYETAQDHQIHLGIDRIRVAEILYQPKAIIGLDSMGLMESIAMILSQIQPIDIQSKVSRNIFVTGGNSLICNFKERLMYEMRQIREPGTKFNIVGGDNILDSWMGAKKWTTDHLNVGDWNTVSISRKEYQEYGYDYLKEHDASNLSTFKYHQK
ncbi:actin related protein 5 [Cavenderia fasciculata]|uniref:Actin related protein 5 n=1 Tax=Cavenderia fasciculata TaxID=261658 RepID=F4QBN0_CACFS|nr:actin related protein 5 [Cavenderia fasciculata]EGG14618.1 actin related protein 5 [Cavenderia fasciculata]|eukprot:XP_004351126.1 actin related protein 5 [Cavenderia fasciculata]